MRGIAVALLATLAVVAAAPKSPQRIVGGSETTIEQWPYTASLLYSWNYESYTHICGGTILNARSILTAAHCISGYIIQWRIRIGSTYANSGGDVHNVEQLYPHTNFNSYTKDYDIAVIRSATILDLDGTKAAAGNIAGANYHVPDNAEVWAVGWGATTHGGVASEQLHHVQIWTVNQELCRQRYAELGYSITGTMICSGWLDVGGRDQCQGDSGGPLIHNGVVVGVYSWATSGCAQARYPGVNSRVSASIYWIRAYA